MTALVVVGDLMLGDSAATVGYGIHSRYPGASLESVFGELADLFRGNDLVIGNLEGPLSATGAGRLTLSRKQMRGDPEYATVLRAAHVDAVGLANNHAMQHGKNAFDETVAALAQNGIVAFGLRGSGRWTSRPAVVSVDGFGDVGILGYCWRPRQYGRSEPSYAEGESASILADIERLRPSVRYLVVSLHWGDEFVDVPSKRDRAFAIEAVTAGADLIFGHHPHVVRPIERFGRAVVAYSLGNAVSDMTWLEQLRRGAALRVPLDGSDPSVTMLRTDDDYVTRVLSAWSALPSSALDEVDDYRYQLEVVRTVRAQRAALYRHAARNLGRYSARVAAELAATTLYNKVSALWGNDA